MKPTTPKRGWIGMVPPGGHVRIRTRRRATLSQKVRHSIARKRAQIASMWQTMQARMTIRTRARAVSNFQLYLRPSLTFRMWLWIKRVLASLKRSRCSTS